MDYQILQPSQQGPVLVVTINRPESLNALNTRFFDELDALLSNEAMAPDLRAIVITGSGKAFVAGADISEMVSKTPPEASEFSRRGQKTFQTIVNHPIPIIAAVNGFALGGGMELAMACDFRIASNLAKFGQPEVNLGLIPGYAATQRLSRLVGMGTALYMLTTGEMVTAEEALRIGLVQKLTEPDKLMEEAMRLANMIALKGPKAVKTVKSVTRNGYHMPFPLACELEAQTFGTLFVDEGIEGMTAFLEKRKPVW
ncbi:MAG: enoyl-CoA hydratase/isomerase family protein [Bacteroidales bacterium]|nr:enoyl-CoA hydratase/isomerase family protein [Bacteroidales bacterium]